MSKTAVDQIPAPPRLFVLALQHVLAMYAGAVTVPLVLASALHLGPDQTAYLVSSDLVACGIVTLLQCIGLGPVGVRLPVMMGVTFVSVGPGIAIASNPALGLPGIFGATIVSGLLGVGIAPLFSRLSSLFAPVVTGTALLLIGISLMGVAVNWIAGGPGGGPGDLWGIAMAAMVVATIVVILRFGRGFIANAAILIGILCGFALAGAGGRVDLGHVATARWFSLVSPLHFGAPRFDLAAIFSMTIVMLITMVESSGMLFALGRIVERPLTSADLARGLRADAFGALIGGLFNSLPYTSYSQNVAIVAMTGVRSRYVCAAAGGLLILLGAIPKLSYLVTAIPPPVLGGAALLMFGMVAANGVLSLGLIDFAGHRQRLYVVALGLAIGLIPNINPHFFDNLPAPIASYLHNGVMLGILSAIVLNLALERSDQFSADPREGADERRESRTLRWLA
jgi:NCS2 family nucleobase:cation symporter-2